MCFAWTILDAADYLLRLCFDSADEGWLWDRFKIDLYLFNAREPFPRHLHTSKKTRQDENMWSLVWVGKRFSLFFFMSLLAEEWFHDAIASEDIICNPLCALLKNNPCWLHDNLISTELIQGSCSVSRIELDEWGCICVCVLGKCGGTQGALGWVFPIKVEELWHTIVYLELHLIGLNRYTMEC